jgi:RHS repeat-associated protein
MLSTTYNYIVDKARWTLVTNGAGQYLAYSDNFYDGNTNPGLGVGTKGQLTNSRKYYNVPLVTSWGAGYVLRGSDSSMGYDSYGNLVTTTTYAGEGTTTFNNPVVYSSFGGGSTARTTTFSYDNTFHAFPTQVTYPTVNGVTLSESAGYDYGLGVLTSVTDANNNVTSAEYDVFGRMVKLIKPGDTSAAPTVDMQYADWEKPYRYVVQYKGYNANGRPTTQFYDGMGRLIQTKAETLDGAQNVISDTQYNSAGQVWRQSQPRLVNETAAAPYPFWYYTQPDTDTNMRWTTTTYDALGRASLVTAPDASTARNYYGYDTNVQMLVVSSRDGNNHANDRYYDIFGRLRYVNEFSGNGGSEGAFAAYAQTYYAYNNLDQLTQVRDNNNNWTSISYDSLGRKTAMSDPDMGSWSYSYDINGNLTSQTDAKSQTLGFSYDALNRLTQKTFGANISQYFYDEAGFSNGKGRLTRKNNANSRTDYQYDSRGRVSNQSQYIYALGSWKGLNYSYDGGDKVVSMQYPGGETVSYGYDAAGRQSSVCTSYGGCYLSNATYNALSQPLQHSLGNGLIQSYSYSSPLSRLGQIQVGTSGSPGSVMNRSYTYDNAGNVKTIVDNAAGQTENFNYDHRDRLTQAWTSGSSTNAYNESYSYDTIGNITAKAGVSYTYPGSGQARPHAPSSVGGSTYNYDNNGNLTSGSGRTYSWNHENKPTSITGSDGVTEGYGYDADGDRVSRTRQGVTTYYVGGGIHEQDSTETWRNHISFGGKVIAQRSGTATTLLDLIYLHGDHLGSTGVVTNWWNGGVISSQKYDPWGKVRGGTGVITQTTISYTGQTLDGTGLLFYNARYYDPNVAKFVSAEEFPAKSNSARKHLNSFNFG